MPSRFEGTPAVVVRGAGSGFAQEIVAGPHRAVADEPVTSGGTGTGLSPYDLLLSALGACTSITLGLYARRKGWALEGVTVRLRHSRVHAADSASAATKEVRLNRIEREIALAGPLTDEQRERLFEIAKKCPVHRTLTSEIRIDSWLA